MFQTSSCSFYRFFQQYVGLNIYFPINGRKFESKSVRHCVTSSTNGRWWNRQVSNWSVSDGDSERFHKINNLESFFFQPNKWFPLPATNAVSVHMAVVLGVSFTSQCRSDGKFLVGNPLCWSSERNTWIASRVLVFFAVTHPSERPDFSVCVHRIRTYIQMYSTSHFIFVTRLMFAATEPSNPHHIKMELKYFIQYWHLMSLKGTESVCGTCNDVMICNAEWVIQESQKDNNFAIHITYILVQDLWCGPQKKNILFVMFVSFFGDHFLLLFCRKHISKKEGDKTCLQGFWNASNSLQPENIASKIRTRTIKFFSEVSFTTQDATKDQLRSKNSVEDFPLREGLVCCHPPSQQM